MKTLPYISIFLFLQCCFAFNIHAQTGEIQGKVSDAETGETLPFVNIMIDGSGELLGTSTDFDGVYSASSLPTGFYTMTYSYVGFHTVQVENVQIEKDKTTFLDLELHPQEILGKSTKIVLKASDIKKTLGKIKGKVVDAQTGETIPFVNVAINVGGNLVGTTTDFDGLFELDSIRTGRYTVTFSYVGYQTVQIDAVEVRKYFPATLDTQLKEYEGGLIGCPPIIGYDPPLFDSDDTRSGITIKRVGNGLFYPSNIR